MSLIDETRSDVTLRGEGRGLAVLDWAEAVLYNGLGRYEEACAAALRVVGYPHDLSTTNWGTVEWIRRPASMLGMKSRTQLVNRLRGYLRLDLRPRGASSKRSRGGG